MPSQKNWDSLSSWMKNISDNVSLSELTIPGTHDSCALYGGASAQCQTLNLTSQLELGIRFIDIRCRPYYNQFPIHHASIYQNIDFGSGVRDVCVDFLSKNPSETIIMSVKNEESFLSPAKGNTYTFSGIFSLYMKGFENLWYLGDTIPKLADVRGKIVLLRRFDTDFRNDVLGIDASPSKWVDNATFAIVNSNGVSIKVQDEYKVPTAGNIDDKWHKVKELLVDSVANNKTILYINFTSGAIGDFPIMIAEGSPGITGVNDFLSNYLNTLAPNRYGIIALNFPEYPNHSLTETIVNLNHFSFKPPAKLITTYANAFKSSIHKIESLFRPK